MNCRSSIVNLVSIYLYYLPNANKLFDCKYNNLVNREEKGGFVWILYGCIIFDNGKWNERINLLLII